MSNSRVARYAGWLAVVAAPLLSILIIGLVTGTNLISLDAWNTKWNDELFYNRVIRQMHEVGAPTGVAGYNEVPAQRPSYGTYSMFIYIPYYLGAFLTGWGSHNFMYIMNVGFGILACALVVLILRPNVRESLLCAGIMLFQFVITRLICSGMTEASYIVFAALFGSCAIYVARNCASREKRHLVIAALVAMVVACGFWGAMRPYILALMLAVWLVLWKGDFASGKGLRIGLGCASVVVALASLFAYLYCSRYYAAPYFTGTTFGNTLLGEISRALPSLAHKHVAWVTYAATSILHLRRQGVMMFMFIVELVLLIAMFVKTHKQGDKTHAALFLGFVLAGIAILEAHLLIYTYQQMHRTMICICLVYLLAIVWHGGLLRRDGKPVAPIAFGVALSLVCCGCLVVRPAEFELPQGTIDVAADAALQDELAQLMPRADDPWDNTVAHAVETKNLYLIFELPTYINTNTIKYDALKQKMDEHSFKSKYMCVSKRFKANERLAQSYKKIYEGHGHIIYELRD